MNTSEFNWLPHLEDSIPIDVQGQKVSSYAIALEGWRRGLTLKYIDHRRNIHKIRYSLSSSDKEIVFAGSRGNLVTSDAVKICIDKSLTKKYLEKAGVPTPEGKKFTKENADKELIAYSKKLGYPVVLKPVSGSGGDGVIANIKSQKEFVNALKFVKYELKYSDLIVEKYFEGVDYRVYVIGDKVVAAFDRIPANVIGDGTSTIKQLVKIKIDERQKNPALYNRPIIIDQEVHDVLSSKNYDLNTIPKKGERVFLKTKNNVSSGGDSRDVTDKLTDEIKKVAVKATKAVPGLLQAGLDIIVNEDTGSCVVLEINSRPSIRNHIYPMIGEARDVPKAIIDYYFPETKDKNITPNDIRFYYNLKDIYKIIEKGFVSEVTIPSIPRGKLIAKQIVLKGESLNMNYAKRIQTRARKNNLHGHINLYSDGKRIELILAGKQSSFNRFRNFLHNNRTNEKKNILITESNWESSIQVGLEIKKVKHKRKKNKVKVKQVQNKQIKERKSSSLFKKILNRIP